MLFLWPLVLILRVRMKRKRYFFCFLCAVFLFAGGQAHGANLPSDCFRQTLRVKTFLTLGDAAHTEFTPSNPAETTTNADRDLSIEDDEDGQELIGKQAPIIKPNSIVVTLSALPPPVSIASKIIASTHTSSSRCLHRYLVHRALLI